MERPTIHAVNLPQLIDYTVGFALGGYELTQHCLFLDKRANLHLIVPQIKNATNVQAGGRCSPIIPLPPL